jgi:UDP-GlcNAc:undecaprenyl-phosphate/decaprenyl-phosphate GlcNAc-1-phosphate transferase
MIYALMFLLPFAFSLPLTHVARLVGKKLKIYDEPSSRRANSRRIPRLGGIAIAVSFFIPTAAVLYWHGLWAYCSRDLHNLFVAICFGSIAVLILGLWDDISGLRARYKLFLQIAISMAVYFMGVQIHAVNLPFIGLIGIGDYALPITILWIVGAMNALNLIDGVDGLCGGVVLAASSALFIFALMSGFALVGFVSLAICGSIFGFLFFNFAPASIFMGDSGSYFLGFLISTLAIICTPDSDATVLSVMPVLLLAVPIFDTFLTIVRRIAQGRPIVAPDRGHLHHRLLEKGFSPRAISAIVFCFSAALASSGIVAVLGNSIDTLIALLVAAVLCSILFYLSGISINRMEVSSDRIYADIIKSDQLRRHLPSFYIELMLASNWGQLQIILEEFSKRIDLCVARINIGDNGNAITVWNWQHIDSDKFSRRVATLSKAYKILDGEREIGEWYLAWNSELAGITKETDALLSVTAGVIGKAWIQSMTFDSDNATGTD